MKTFSTIISNLFQPLLIPTYALILLFQVEPFESVATPLKLYITLAVAMLTAVVPLLSILILKKVGVVSSIQLYERKERTLPYLFTLLSYVSAIFFLWKVFMPYYSYIIFMMIGVLCAVALVAIINLKWKISAHLCGIGGLCAAVMVSSIRMGLNFSLTLIVLFILSGMVATSRIVLKAHTPSQTLAGFVLGFLFVAISGLFF